MRPFSAFRPFARLQPATPIAFQFKDGFWGTRRQQLSKVILPRQIQKIRETGRLENFSRAAGKSKGVFKGYYFNDSDVYKWLEAASWTTLFDSDLEIRNNIETVITAILEAQQSDGYLNTYFMFEKVEQRWANLQDMHELYCAGHLFEAAVAHNKATQSDRLLNVARKLADHIISIFGPQGRPGTPGHPEIELALIKLYEASGKEAYLHLAQSFIDNRGKGLIGGKPYHQDHIPLRKMEHLVGHAVRAVYLCSGATDIYQYTGEADLRTALERLWNHMLGHLTYVSGGIGSRYEGESFGEEFELPNGRAYTETCAAIASLLWSQRMLQIEGQPIYADLMEWMLFNAVLPGISLDGTGYFYVNPLANDGSHRREEWFDCACCPPNIARILASLPVFLFSQSAETLPGLNENLTLWLHSYAQGKLSAVLSDGQNLSLELTGDYPWQGEVKVEVKELEYHSFFGLALRIPGWCEGKPRVWLNEGEIACTVDPGNYLHINRQWQRGDVICMAIPITTRLLASHPFAIENTSRIALARGPILYCLEAADNPEVDLRQVVLPVTSPISELYQPELLNGVVTLEADAFVEALDPIWGKQLYQPLQHIQSQKHPFHLRAVPYFAWANRQAGQMQTWLKVE